MRSNDRRSFRAVRDRPAAALDLPADLCKAPGVPGIVDGLVRTRKRHQQADAAVFYAFPSGSTCSASLNTLLAIMNTPMAVATTMVSSENAERSLSNSASGMRFGSLAKSAAVVDQQLLLAGKGEVFKILDAVLPEQLREVPAAHQAVVFKGDGVFKEIRRRACPRGAGTPCPARRIAPPAR